MKVTKDEEFAPITIVVQTKDEADWLWFCLNTDSATVVEENYAWRERAKELADKSIDIEIYDAFAAVHIMEEDD